MKAKINPRLTSNRANIFKMIEKAATPVCVDTIYLELIKTGNKLNLSTVYRGLDCLVTKGLVKRITIGEDNRFFYEVAGLEHHHFLRCLGCGLILPLEDCPIKEYEKDLSKKTDFIISGHKLELVGYCSSCSKGV